MCASVLLNAGADVNQTKSSNGANALMIAAQGGHEQCLIKAGANVNATCTFLTVVNSKKESYLTPSHPHTHFSLFVARSPTVTTYWNVKK